MSQPSLQIAFLTGQADPDTCALSPAQRRFLDRVAAAAGATTVHQNFPYTLRTAPWRPRPLWRASVSVALQYWSARRPAFARRHQAAVRAMLDGADETVLLAGSCGLELWQRLHLPAEAVARVSFVAYGAVTRHRPSGPGLVVLGRRDWIARGRGPVPDRMVACDHLSYLADAEFAALTVDFVRRRLAAARRAHATIL